MKRTLGRVFVGVGTVTVALVIAGLALPQCQPQADAVGATPGYPGITGPSSAASGGLNTAITIGNFTLTDASAGGSACNIGTVRAVLSTDLGTITATAPSGGSVSGSGTATVTLTGSVANVEASLDAATLSSASAGTATVTTTFRPNNTFTSGSDSYVFGNTTGHYYRVYNNSTSVVWSTMRTNANSTSFCGAGGYLTTITTADERTSIQSLSSYADAAYWLGAVRSSSSSTPNGSACTSSSCLWYWDPGSNAPSSDQAARMSYGDPGNPPGTNVGTPWHSGEPNNSGPYLALSPASSVYNWDDVASGITLQYGLIEFGNNTSYTVASVTSTVLVAQCTATTTNYTADGTNGVNGARYRVVSFTSGARTACASTWSAPTGITSVDVLVVGGGGGGGSDAGGGGGGGGVRERSSVTVSGGSSYAVTVGAGGSAARCPRNADYNNSDNCDPRSLATYDGAGASGGSSSFDSITSTGGGGGGSKFVSAYASNAPGDGVAGASGGGGGHPTSQPGGAGSYATDGNAETLGNAGGTSDSGNDFAAGGGGAGGAGSNGTASGPGAGGAGATSVLTGASVTYGAGGAGGRHSTGSTATASSGGGNGAGRTSAAAAGTNGRGGGGGGGGNVGAGFGTGGDGGSGVVILRYRIDISSTTTDQDTSTASTVDVAFGKVGTAFSQALTFSGGLGPTFSYAVVSGSLPAGLGLDGATGRTLTISGTPTVGGISTVTIRATDADAGNIPTDQQVTIAITDLVMPSLLLADPRATSLTTPGPSTLAGGANMVTCVYSSNASGAELNTATVRTDTASLGSTETSRAVGGATVTLSNDNGYGVFKAHGSTAANLQSLLGGANGLRITKSTGQASGFYFTVKVIPYWSSVPACTDSNGGTMSQVVQVKPLGIKRTVTTPVTVE